MTVLMGVMHKNFFVKEDESPVVCMTGSVGQNSLDKFTTVIKTFYLSKQNC